MIKQLVKGSFLQITLDKIDQKECSELVRVLKRSQGKPYQIIIASEYTLAELHIKIGQAIIDSTKFDMGEIPEILFPSGDTSMAETTGRVFLDTMITKTYFIKSEAEKKIYEIRGEE